jgi:probable addiction module antidote protein
MRTTVSHDEFLRERLADAAFAAEYLQAALEDGDTAVLLLALRRIAEARGGMTKLARETGLTREALYRTLSGGGNPRLTSLRAILAASGLRLTVAPANPGKRTRKASRTAARV